MIVFTGSWEGLRSRWRFSTGRLEHGCLFFFADITKCVLQIVDTIFYSNIWVIENLCLYSNWYCSSPRYTFFIFFDKYRWLRCLDIFSHYSFNIINLVPLLIFIIFCFQNVDWNGNKTRHCDSLKVFVTLMYRFVSFQKVLFNTMPLSIPKMFKNSFIEYMLNKLCINDWNKKFSFLYCFVKLSAIKLWQ